MTEYIEREALFAEFDRLGLGEHSLVEKVFSDGVRTIIADMPAADVAPVVHGRWIEKEAPAVRRYFECSNCGAHENKHTAIKGYYCWRCGAKMDGGMPKDGAD